jgi:hypothetical protein
MSVKEMFSDEDWNKVLEAPLLAGFAVTAADPGGLIGAFQESAAIAKSLKASADAGGEGSLEHAIAESYKTSEGRAAARDGVKSIVKGKRPAEASQAAVDRLAEIVKMVEGVAPDRAATLRNFILNTATATAEAATEGGFLGFGGEEVSDAERKSIDELKTALGVASL